MAGVVAQCSVFNPPLRVESRTPAQRVEKRPCSTSLLLPSPLVTVLQPAVLGIAEKPHCCQARLRYPTARLATA